MDCIGKECTLLYKQNISAWLEDQKKVGKFSNKDLDFVNLIATNYSKEDNDKNVPDFILDNHIGSVYYTVPDLELFSFTEADGTVTKFTLRLEGSNLDCGLDDHERELDTRNDVPKSSSDRPRDFKKVYICSFVNGSICGRKFLAYASEGHIFLMDLDEKSGVIVGRWPIDPRSLQSGCCSLMPYEPNIFGAVTTDHSLVAIYGPREGDTDVHDGPFIEIRLFDVNTHECTIKKMNLDPTLEFGEEDLYMMSFNPLYPHLIYITFASDNDDDDDDDDFSSSSLNLVLFDTNTEKVIAKRTDTLMMLSNYFYETIGNAVYLCHGNIIVTYKLADRSIVLVNALSLDAIGTVNFSFSTTVLQFHFCVSTCQTELAIFKDDKTIFDSELKYEVEVYKIPDGDLSLKNLCRRKIGRFVSRDQIDMLFMLPASLRDYLRL